MEISMQPDTISNHPYHAYSRNESMSIELLLQKNTLTFNISGSEPSIHYFIFKPITPIMIIPIDAIFKKLTGSSNHKIPMVAIRPVPKPDQTA